MVGATLLVGGVLLQHAEAEPAASRVIDRTFRCTTVLQAGIRKIRVSASAAVPGQKDVLGGPARPFAEILTGGSIGEIVIARMSGGAPTPLRPTTLWVGADRCTSTAKRVALAGRGLDGSPASPFGDAFECVAPKSVLVRVRGFFGSLTKLRQSSRERLTTNALLKEGYLMVRTESAKPLVYAEVLAPGKTRLFTARACVPD